MKIVRCKDVKVIENKGNTNIYSNMEKWFIKIEKTWITIGWKYCLLEI